MNRLVSPISIDLGAKNTGVFLSHYNEGEAISSNHSQAVTLVMPEDGGGMTWSQQNRTATRHRVRGNERRKMAKRLLKLVTSQLCMDNKITLSELQWGKAWEALSGCLNRRGYNRLDIELDETSIDLCDPDWFAEVFPAYFTTCESLAEQWARMLENPKMLRDFSQDPLMALTPKDLKKLHLAGYDKDEQNQIAKAHSTVRQAVHNVLQEQDFGHKHRRDYLSAIKLDMHKDSRLFPITEIIGLEPLWRLVGNISNLQLRALRWYFNDKDMAEADLWKPDSLQVVLERWLQYWRPESVAEKEQRKQAVVYLHKSNDPLVFLTGLDPEITIPPYEDQDNRRPPKDQTLWLSPSALTSEYGDKWTIWAQKLLQANPGWDDGLDVILSYFDRKSRLPKVVRGKTIESDVGAAELKASYVLQRLLDRSRKLDNYAFRLLIRGRHTQSASQPLDELTKDLGSQHIELFLSFCERYYSEVDLARQGLWRADTAGLLERSDLNPPHKSKILYQLVGSVLGEKLDKLSLGEFRSNLWTARKLPRGSTLKGACAVIEECRKNQGNLFNERLRRLTYRVDNQGENAQQFTGDDKVIWAAWQKTQQAADAITEHFTHTAEAKAKYANPFTMSQLYNLLERDRKGFSNTTLAAHLENAWRMTDAPGVIKSAYCSRLAADSIRPFDGVLKRILERQAWEIANYKATQLIQQEITHSTISLPILIEENRFAFSEALVDVKKAGAPKRKRFSDRLQRQASRWEEKDIRIRSASQGICPYTGEPISTLGEIDHILPRAASRSSRGTVFNSEANLIWCSRKGNQDKADKRYLLQDLHAVYLSKQFGTSDIVTIQHAIEATVNSLDRAFVFDALVSDEQVAVRHALFLPSGSPAYQRVEWQLARQMSARVNGTQAWLTRAIMEKLDVLLMPWAKEHNNQIIYSAARISAEDASAIRKQLGTFQDEFSKQEVQPIVSHVLDALCVFAAAAATPKTMPILAQGEGLSEHMPWVAKAMPEVVTVSRVERKKRYDKTNVDGQPLFKKGIYGEEFLPLWISSESILVGFDPSKTLIKAKASTCEDVYCLPLKVEGAHPELLLDYLTPLLMHPGNVEAAQKSQKPQRFIIDKALAFELLNRVAKQPATDRDLQQAKLLDALYYNTVREEVWKGVYNAAKKTFNNDEEILKDEKFKMKVNFSIGRGKNADVQIKGQLFLPAMRDWQRFIEQPELQNLIGEKCLLPQNHRQICEQFFNIKQAKNRHKKVKREFSLPVIDTPSGGYRIARMDPSGQKIWQMQALDGLSAIGFEVNAGQIDWGKLAPLPSLERSNGVVGKGQRYSPPTDMVVKFDQWLPLEHESIPSETDVEMAPGTKSRPYIRVSQPFATFALWLEGAIETVPTSPMRLMPEIKVAPKPFSSNHGCKLLGKPRSTIFIEQVGKVVNYRYEVSNGNSEMKSAYQKAYIKFLKR